MDLIDPVRLVEMGGALRAPPWNDRRGRGDDREGVPLNPRRRLQRRRRIFRVGSIPIERRNERSSPLIWNEGRAEVAAIG